MARYTTIKKGSIDLESVFSPGFLTDTDGKLIAGYKWVKQTLTLPQNNNDITTFQISATPLVLSNELILHFFVNGVQISASKISINQAESTILDYDNSDYPIDSTDVVEVYFVPAS